jgi:hypothetical protein
MANTMKNPNATIINSLNEIAKVDCESKFSENNRNESQMENIIGLELQKHYKILKDGNVNIQMKSEENFKEEKELFELQCNELEQQLKEIKSQIQLLKQKNNNYQSTTGISYCNHNNIIFNNDILELQDNLENYVTNLKPKIDVNINEVKKLLIKYGCQSKISGKGLNKPLIIAVLQRHVLEEILAQADFYFKGSNKEESDIIWQNMILTSLMYNNRHGNTTFGTTSNSEHNFISIISKKINKMMNKYRVIKDIKRKKLVNSLAKDLVINVVRIFYISLHIQGPVAQYHWFNNNEKINKSYMKGNWNEDEVEDLVVEVCSFPLILKPTCPGGFEVCTPAKVFPLHIMKQSLAENLETTVGRKFKNTF